MLLILAGTGVVAAPQILHHRDPMRNLGVATPPRCHFKVPVDVLLSCRKDDVLMVPELTSWCQDTSKAKPRHPSHFDNIDREETACLLFIRGF